jgi:HSP20 family protein
MTLIHWEPAREYGSLQTEMNRLFSSFFESGSAGGGAGWQPALDVAENDDAYLVAIDLPGMRQEEIAIELHDRTLTISGERRGLDGDRLSRRERPSGTFRRTLTIPDGVDPDAVQASFADGVLAVQIPKPEHRKPRRVEIQMGGRDLIEA